MHVYAKGIEDRHGYRRRRAMRGVLGVGLEVQKVKK
jgi:hypothetical protein